MLQTAGRWEVHTGKPGRTSAWLFRKPVKNKAEGVGAGIVRLVFCWVKDKTPVPASGMIRQALELLNASFPA
ncbi:hypothetical protein A3860_39770 [Niastella vici]|uniref:Uncharacterized protein n=1 Tax=Niastella vici TaxID=1703345 RepID=A0A1V9FHT6_9BACT|nr:hypothetical protein A3860_39770 [Niastella vici]